MNYSCPMSNLGVVDAVNTSHVAKKRKALLINHMKCTSSPCVHFFPRFKSPRNETRNFPMGNYANSSWHKLKDDDFTRWKIVVLLRTKTSCAQKREITESMVNKNKTETNLIKMQCNETRNRFLANLLKITFQCYTSVKRDGVFIHENYTHQHSTHSCWRKKIN